MTLTETPICNFGEKAKDFNLKGTDGKIHKLEDHLGKYGILIMFICNHCPYVKAVIKEIVKDAEWLRTEGIKSVAIMSNDTKNYPEDSFENMISFSRKHKFNFPYLLDENQEVARSYGAVCTPDFFGYNNKLELQYRGRIRELKDLKPVGEPLSPFEENLYKKTGKKITRGSELRQAMQKVADTGDGPEEQFPSMGCNIKWFK